MSYKCLYAYVFWNVKQIKLNYIVFHYFTKIFDIMDRNSPFDKETHCEYRTFQFSECFQLYIFCEGIRRNDDSMNVHCVELCTRKYQLTNAHVRKNYAYWIQSGSSSNQRYIIALSGYLFRKRGNAYMAITNENIIFSAKTNQRFHISLFFICFRLFCGELTDEIMSNIMFFNCIAISGPCEKKSDSEINKNIWALIAAVYTYFIYFWIDEWKFHNIFIFIMKL